jgi:hypothetical protein
VRIEPQDRIITAPTQRVPELQRASEPRGFSETTPESAGTEAPARGRHAQEAREEVEKPRVERKALRGKGFWKRLLRL